MQVSSNVRHSICNSCPNYKIAESMHVGSHRSITGIGRIAVVTLPAMRTILSSHVLLPINFKRPFISVVVESLPAFVVLNFLRSLKTFCVQQVHQYLKHSESRISIT